MARVTVEDCITKIPNRFELVMKAAQRARNVSAGAALTIERDKDKNPVVALREIADDTIEIDELEEQLVKSLQQYIEADEPAEDEMDAASMQDEIASESGVASMDDEIREDVLTVETEEQEFSLSIGEDVGAPAGAPGLEMDEADDSDEPDEPAPVAAAPDDSAFANARFEDVSPEDQAGSDGDTSEQS